jgi:hypothetical protein
MLSRQVRNTPQVKRLLLREVIMMEEAVEILKIEKA